MRCDQCKKVFQVDETVSSELERLFVAVDRGWLITSTIKMCEECPEVVS